MPFGNPKRSEVTNTTLFPAASSNARALAQRSCRVPSDGLSLNPNPAIHIFCEGVIIVFATPAFQPELSLTDIAEDFPVRKNKTEMTIKIIRFI